MAMLEMLSEVVCSEKLLHIVAFTKFMHGSQVLETLIPIWFRVVRKLLATISTCVMRRARSCLCRR